MVEQKHVRRYSKSGKINKLLLAYYTLLALSLGGCPCLIFPFLSLFATAETCGCRALTLPPYYLAQVLLFI